MGGEGARRISQGHDPDPKAGAAAIPTFQPNRMPQPGLKPRDLMMPARLQGETAPGGYSGLNRAMDRQIVTGTRITFHLAGL
jgi:hypothetical protein